MVICVKGQCWPQKYSLKLQTSFMKKYQNPKLEAEDYILWYKYLFSVRLVSPGVYYFKKQNSVKNDHRFEFRKISGFLKSTEDYILEFYRRHFTSDIMLTPKLGAASISNVQFMYCNSQLLGAGRALSKIAIATPSFGVSMIP